MGKYLDEAIRKKRKQEEASQNGEQSTNANKRIGPALRQAIEKKNGNANSKDDYITDGGLASGIDKYLSLLRSKNNSSSNDTNQHDEMANPQLSRDWQTFADYEKELLSYQDRIKNLEFLDDEELEEYSRIVQNYLTVGGKVYTEENGYSQDAIDNWQTMQAQVATKAANDADVYESFFDEKEFEHWKSMDTVEKRKAWYASSKSRLAEINNQLDAGGLSKDEKKALKKERDKLESEMKLYETGQRSNQGLSYGYKVADDYSDLTLNADFGKKSKPTIDFSAEAEEAEFDPDIYAEPSTPLFQQDPLGYYLATGKGKVKGSAEIDARAKEGSWDMLKQPEIDTYYYIMNTQGVEAATQYLYDMKVELNRRQTYANAAEWALKYQEGNIAKKIGMNAFSVPANVYGSVPGFVENVGSWVRGEAINPYTGGQKGMHYTTTVRGLTGSAIDEATGNKSFLGIKGSDVYQTGMSRADSMLATSLLGGTAGSAVLGMSAAQNKAYDLYQQGASDNQILIASVAAGAAEMIFEKMSYGELKELGGADTFGKFMGNMAVQGVNEMREEAATELADILTDMAVRGNMSEVSTLLEENNGDWGDVGLVLLGRVWKSGVGGFLGGAGAAVTQTAQANVGNQIHNYKVGEGIKSADGGVAALQSMAQEKAEAIGEIDKRQSRRLMRQANNISEKSSSAKVGALYNSMLTASGKQHSAADQADIAKSLKRSGIEESLADEVAAALVAQYNGTSSQAQNELLDDMAESEEMHKAMRNIVLNDQSTMGQRRQDVRDFVASVKKGSFSTKTAQTAAQTTTKDATTAKENAAKEIDVADGTFVKSSGESVQSIKISSIEDGKVTVTVNGDTDVSLKDVSFAKESTSIAYDAVTSVGDMSATAANMILGSSKASSPAFVRQAITAYEAGVRGTDVQAKLDPNVISTKEAKALYMEGMKTVARQNDAVYNTYMRAKGVLQKTGKKAGGKVTITDGVVLNTKQQKAAAALASEISPALSVDIVLEQNDNPRKFGYYDHKTDTIHLNVNATWSKASMMAFTLSHELVHRAKTGSPKKFQKFSSYLVEQYNEAGVSVDDLIGEQLLAAEAAGIELTEDEAFEEVVCDAAQSMLTDTDAGKKLAEWGKLSKEHRDIVDVIRDLIAELFDKLRAIFKDVDNDSDAARAFRSLDKDVQQILADMFVDMSKDAAEKLGTIKAAGMLDKLNGDGKAYKMTSAEIQAVQNIGRISVNQFSSADIKATERFAQQYWKEMGVKSPFFRAWFGDWRANDQKTKVQIATQRGDARGVQKNTDTGWNIQVSGQVFNETNRHTKPYNIAAKPYLPYINSIVENAVLLDSFGIDRNKLKSPNSLLMHSLYAVADIGKGPEIIKLYVEEMNDPNKDNTTKRAYQLQNVEKYQLQNGSSHKNASSIKSATGIIRTVADLFAAVKQKDSSFQPKPVSGIVNADGTPKVMYHGSPAKFTIFDKKKAKSSGQYGSGFYFTDSESHAGTYGEKYSVYLNIKKPLQYGASTVTKAQVKKFLEAVAENEDYSIENYGTYDINSVLQTVMGSNANVDAFKVIQDISATAIGDMVEAAELFNTVNGTKFDGIIAATETVAFYPEQIKSATDNIGTFDGGNPDIRYKVSAAKDAEYMRAVDSWDKETQQKLVDAAAADAGAILAEDGKPLKLYRGTLGGQTKFAKEDTYGGKVYTIDNVHVATRYGDKSGEATEMRYQTEGEKTTYALYGFPKKMLTMDAQYGVWSDLAIPEELRKYADGRYKATNAEIADWAEQEGYDALRINNVRDGSFDHGSEVIFFNENAVKSADPVTYGEDGKVVPLSERFNESKNDLRYKVAARMDSEANTVLESENANLRDDVERLRELVKMQGTVTGGTKFTPSSVEAAARKIKKTAVAKVDTKELSNRLNSFYEYIAKNEDLTWENVREKAKDIATWLMENRLHSRSAYAQDILDTMRGSKIYLDESQMAEAEYRFESYGNYRKTVSGAVTISKNADMSLDSWWHEMSTLYPDVFDPNVSASDMPSALADIIDDLRNDDLSVLEYEYNRKLIAQDLIRDIYDSYWNASPMKTVADRYSKKITDLKTAHVHRIEKLRIENRQKIEQMREQHQAEVETIRNAFRDKLSKQRSDMSEKYRESRQKASENRRTAELRGKIQRLMKDMQKTLAHPTDGKYVPSGLFGAMVKVLEILDTDGNQYNPDGTINLAQQKREEMREHLHNLQREYERLKADEFYITEYDDAITEYIKVMEDEFAGKKLKDLTLDEAYTLYETLQSINDTIRDARKMIGWGEAADVYEVSDSVAANQRAVVAKRKDGKRTWVGVKNDKRMNLTLSPMRNVERMSGYDDSAAFVKVFRDIEKGVRAKNFFVMNSYKMFEKVATGKEYDKAVYEPFGEKYKDKDGREFRISKMQMMQAILSYEREQSNKNMRHIETGGFAFADLDLLRKGKISEATSKEHSHDVPAAGWMIAEFNEALKNDSWAQSYMQTAREFFNTKAKDAINKASLAVKHRIVATGEAYIPFAVDRTQVVKEVNSTYDIQETISGYGMLQETKKNAQQPLVITGLNNIVSKHIDQVGSVYGLSVPIRNFNKVWNTKSGEGRDTIKGIMEKNWGVDGVKHIEQAVKDVQGPRISDKTDLYNKVKSNFISSTFLLNGSVVSKQVASLFTATSMIRWRDPISQLVNLGITMAKHKKIAAEVDKYTATAWLRREGLSNAELSTMMTEKKKGIVVKAADALYVTKVISAMDHAVALSLWNYCKKDVARETGLKGEALLKATADFYDDVIERTQSVNDPLHRPEIQKSGKMWLEPFALFKTDLYQTAGQLNVAAGRAFANPSKKNKLALARTVYAMGMSALWGQAMSVVFAMLRFRPGRYRDDETGEVTWESILKRAAWDYVKDFAGFFMPMLGGELVGIADKLIIGNDTDIFSNMTLDKIEKLYTRAMNILEAVVDPEKDISAQQFRQIAAIALDACGVPASNIQRIFTAIQKHVTDFKNGDGLSFDAGFERSAAQHANRIAEAIEDGDAKLSLELYEDAVEDLSARTALAKKREVNDDDISSAKSRVKSGVKDLYKDGDISRATATEFLEKTVKMDEDDIYWEMEAWDAAKADDDGYSKYRDFYEAVGNGRDLYSTIARYTEHGVSTKTLSGRITSYYKPIYLKMSAKDKAKLRGYLINAYVALGSTGDAAAKKIDSWKIEEEKK